jgi:riboflavin synthase
MFTGLIREIGEVLSFSDHRLRIKSRHRAKLGDSIAVNGVCLTVIETFDEGFVVEVADETRRIVPPQKFQGRVHLEPAMRMDDRFEGHIVQGHVDAVGTVRSIRRGENATEFIIDVEREALRYIVPKGSVAIDGISLTVNDVYEDAFRLTIIPHTLQQTLMHTYKVGTKVNIETDLFARYIEHILSRRKAHEASLSWREIDAMSMSF